MSDLKNQFKPETLAMSYGYKPELSEGAVKCPIFQTSTFVFKNAQAGKDFFEVALGKRDARPGEDCGLIYSRLNNPSMEILENRLALWDQAEDCAVFSTGMAAISTTLLELLQPGDVIMHSEPLYGGSDHFIKHILKKNGIDSFGFFPWENQEQIEQRLKDSGLASRLACIYIESPANPTNDLIDIQMTVQLAKKYSRPDRKVISIIDNTFLGPLWQKPLQLGIDLAIYSATKFIGGHSDVIAGACVGSREYIHRIKVLRTYLGTNTDPWTGWLLMRSLETLKIRMTQQMQNAQTVAQWLSEHPKITKIHYPGFDKKNKAQLQIFQRQCLGPGSMISFDVKGTEKQAFKVLDSLKLAKLAVSLGGTESLVEHPKTMTHAGVDEALKEKLGISDTMIRLSVGIEAVEDILWDLEQALAQI